MIAWIYSFFQMKAPIRKINVNMANPAAQIVRGLRFRNSVTSREPANIIPISDTRRTSFRPVAKATCPAEVSSTMISMIVYMVNPYKQEGRPRTRVQPPFSGQEFSASTPAVR